MATVYDAWRRQVDEDKALLAQKPAPGALVLGVTLEGVRTLYLVVAVQGGKAMLSYGVRTAQVPVDQIKTQSETQPR